MAQRRMFAQTIIDSDAFLDMPTTSQLLYFHLAMRADDDGFINKPKGIMRIVGAKDDDLKVLITKKFIIPFESGVVVIKHWRIHNYIQKDRYLETKYKDEKSQLDLDENNAYRLLDTECIQMGHELETQVRLGKDRLGKDSNNSRTFVQPSLEELADFIQSNGYQVNADAFKSHYDSKGWYVGKNRMKDWRAAVRGWHAREVEKNAINRREDVLPEWHLAKDETPQEVEVIDRKSLIEKIKGETK
jgi:hypothetical protein